GLALALLACSTLLGIRRFQSLPGSLHPFSHRFLVCSAVGDLVPIPAGLLLPFSRPMQQQPKHDAINVPIPAGLLLPFSGSPVAVTQRSSNVPIPAGLLLPFSHGRGSGMASSTNVVPIPAELLAPFLTSKRKRESHVRV